MATQNIKSMYCYSPYSNLTDKEKQLVIGYWIRKEFNKNNYSIEVILPIILAFAEIDLIVKKGEKIILSPGKHTFNKIIIEENGILTTTEWVRNENKGATLTLKTQAIIIKKNGSINVNALGYKGGEEEYQGESVKSKGKKNKDANEGGGGGGFYGGGGGYGTKGSDGLYDGGKGGNTYGNVKLDILHLGSGGGGGWKFSGQSGGGGRSGGAGGGALSISCIDISIEKQGSIQANGQHGKGGYGGGGSGGSIYITAKTIKNCGSITALSGMGGGIGGDGGDGIIRIDCNNINKQGGIIKPNAYVG